MKNFALRLIDWQHSHGRHGLPWQGADAYRVWLSEIMLQQTQVVTVIPYFQRFVAHFPDVTALAAASQDEVLALWSGLGYYSRARNLHRAAQQIVERHGGIFPQDFEQIQALPGIGRSTAAAVCALAFHQRHAILDGNVKRVLARHAAIAGWPGDKRVESQLWQEAEARLPQDGVAIYTQALMDMGATVCLRSRPRCAACPVQVDCAALAQDKTADFPAPRPKKAVPERAATFVLLLHHGEILLEKRPSSGIWGGLWCPPQFDDAAAAQRYVAQMGGEGRELATFIHTFTHFKLHITPLRVDMARQPLLAAEPGRVWLGVVDALAAAIPTPVRKMLTGLV
ncbi:MAG: A/G-specific adenine glycosylase [Nitrosomonadales bacterium]|nr:A/G-specific adenine glycosylase [Nitrosomonadales bacterium]